MRSRSSSERSTSPLPATFRWGLYYRISDDRLGEEKGITRQDIDARERVGRRGGVVAKTYPENDTSAYLKRRVILRDENGDEYPAYRVIRPVFQQMVTDLRSGLIDGAMVYDLDRLARDPRDLEDCVELVEHFGRLVESTTPGQIDLTTSSGIAMARVLIAMAAKSSADTGRRVERAHYASALEGKPVGTRAFGWEEDKKTLRPVEADMIRDAVRRLLAGQTLHEVGALWNASGVPSTRGARWQRQTLLTILQNPRLHGVRTYHGEVMLGLDGAPVRGQWEPVLDKETFDRLQVVLRPHRGRGATSGPVGRKYLFSGVLRCAKPVDGQICGTPMVGYPRPHGRPGFSYACKPKSDGGCGGLSISGLHVDMYLEELVLAALETIDAAGVRVEPGPWSGQSQLDRATGRLLELGTMFAEGDMERAEYLHLRDLGRLKIEKLKAERETWLHAQSEAMAPSRDWRTEWQAMSLGQRIGTIKRAHLEAVLVSPSRNRGTRRFEGSRLEPVWGAS